MSDWLDIEELWRQSAGDEPCLLFSIAGVWGSAYRRTGAHMIVSASGKRAGAISAGCLEQDILQQLPSLFEKTRHGASTILQYNNRPDDPFALNRGCSGRLSIIVQQLMPGQRNQIDCFRDAQLKRRCVTWTSDVVLEDGTLFQEKIAPLMRIVIFGSHGDGIAVARLARDAGYEAVVVDWREDLLKLARSVDSQNRLSFQSGRAEALLDYAGDEFTAFVIMSHHYDEDKAALAFLASAADRYVGVMGPRKRTVQMMDELTLQKSQILCRLRYPVGLDIGAETPAQIAISVVGEVMAEFASTYGRSLSTKNGPIHGGKVGIAILAAGAGSRFGGAKQVAQWEGTSLVARAARHALALENCLVAIVTGAHEEDVRAELRGLELTFLQNDQWRTGVASSVRTAVSWARDAGLAGLLIVCCDQPLVTSKHMRELVTGGLTSGSIAASTYDGTVGVPAYFPQHNFDELLALKGEVGAKSILNRHAMTTLQISIPEAGFDIDRPADLISLSIGAS